MNKKLNCVLLIDDDEPTNYFHELVVREADCAEKVVVVQSGKMALDYLRSKEDGEHPQPDLIFLDINMPAMNGWEFLEEYKKLDNNQKSKIVIVMLTTSINPDDKERADSLDCIENFMMKPLTVDVLHEIIDKHFADWK